MLRKKYASMNPTRTCDPFLKIKEKLPVYT